MNVKPILLSILIISLIIPISLSNVSSPSFNVYFDNGGSLGFQSKDQQQVNLTVTSGALNCSNASVRIHYDRGLFRFMSNESLTFTLAYDVSKVQVNDVVAESSGLSYSYVTNDLVKIEWWNITTPYVPITFLFWIVGLVMMFAGPFLGIKHLKKGDYREGLIIITVLCAMGFSLLLGGMFSA